MKQTFILLLACSLLSSCRNTAVDYLSYKDKYYLSIIQFHKAFQKEDPSIYIVKGRTENKVPIDNFVKTKYCDYSAYYSVQNDTTILVMPGWDFDTTLLHDSKFIVLKDFPEADKLKFDYNDRMRFYENIKAKYVSFDRFKLKKDW